MRANLKFLGLALVATLAMSTALAGAAQAEGTLKAKLGSGAEEATVTGNEIEHDGTASHTFTSFLGQTTCENTSFEGTVKDGATELTLTPTYKNCTTNGRPTTVTMNKCDYRFKGGVPTVVEEEEDKHHFENGTVSLECPEEGEKVYIHVYNDAKHEDLRCTYHVEPFGFKGNNTITNTTPTEGKKDVDVTTTVSVSLTRTFGTFLQCGSESQNATYTGGTTLRAYQSETHSEANQVDLTVEKG